MFEFSVPVTIPITRLITSPIPTQNPYYGHHLRKKYGNKNYVTFNLDTSVDGCGGMGNMVNKILNLRV